MMEGLVPLISRVLLSESDRTTLTLLQLPEEMATSPLN
jgi:hypothetical protein